MFEFVKEGDEFILREIRLNHLFTELSCLEVALLSANFLGELELMGFNSGRGLCVFGLGPALHHQSY